MMTVSTPRRQARLAAVVLSASSLSLAQGLEEVTITAQKRASDPLRTGLTVTVLDDAALTSQQVRQADDIAALEPNLSINKPFGNANPVLVMRGVGLQDFNVNNAPNVGLYVDETYLPSNALADFALFDLERVEVLKGPQGALWGRNATGGAVLYRTRQPESASTAAITLRATAPASTGAEGHLNVPVSERAALRLAAVVDRREDQQYLSRTLQDRFGEFDRSALRMSGRFTPTDALTIDGRLEAGRFRGDAYPITHVGIVGPQCPISAGAPATGLDDELRCFNTTTGYSDPDAKPFDGDWNFIPEARRDARLASLRIAYDTSVGTLTSLTSWSDLDYTRGEDNDTSPLALLQIAYRSDIRSVAQELRWAHTSSSGVEWLAGVQASRDEHDEFRVATLAGLFPGLLQDVTLSYDQRVTSSAAFAQLQWPLTPRLTLNAGLRHTRDRLTFSGGSVPGPGPFVPAFVAIAFPGLPAVVSTEQRESDTSGQLGLQFASSERLLLYANLSRGYKPGGVFGGFGLTPTAFTPYGPETIYAFEIGSKWRSSDRRITLTTAAFAYDYRDVQGQTLVQASTGSLPLLSNVGDARILGAEASLDWTPNDRWQLQLAAGLLDTSLRDDVPTLDSLQRPLSLQNRELPHAPRWSMRALVDYRPALTLGSWQPSLSFDALLRARYFNDLPNQQHLAQRSAVSLLGASARLVHPNDRLDVSLWARNLLDERYRLHGNSSGIGNDFVMFSESRTVGLSLSHRWH